MLALISLSLAVINLFPFLPLDGGHIFWALAEKVRGRRIPIEVMERAGFVGVALILMLFVIGLSNDISTLAGGRASTSAEVSRLDASRSASAALRYVPAGLRTISRAEPMHGEQQQHDWPAARGRLTPDADGGTPAHRGRARGHRRRAHRRRQRLADLVRSCSSGSTRSPAASPKLGVGRGDTVAIMLTNRPEFHIVDLAAAMLGATPFSIYTTLPADEIEYLCSDAAGARSSSSSRST